MMRITVGDVMTRDVVTVEASSSLQAAARLLAQRHISGAPVVDAGGRPIGVVTQADLVLPAPGAATVAQVMAPFVFAVPPDRALLDAIRLMAADDIHRVLVVEDGRLLGIVTSMDIVKTLASPAGTRLALDLRYCDDAEDVGP